MAQLRLLLVEPDAEQAARLKELLAGEVALITAPDVLTAWQALQKGPVDCVVANARLPELLNRLRADDLLVITADHGCDPTWRGSDPPRALVPVLLYGGGIDPGPAGRRETFADVGATGGEWLGVDFRGAGVSFLPELLGA